MQTKAEEILEKFAKKNMIQWNQESFKRTHPKLHRTMIEAITEALSSHSVVEQKEQLICNCPLEERNFIFDGLPSNWCTTCGRTEVFAHKTT